MSVASKQPGHLMVMNIFPPSGLYGMNESEKRQVTDCKYGSDDGYNDDLVFHTPFNII